MTFQNWLQERHYPESTIKTYSVIENKLPAELTEDVLIDFLSRERSYHNLFAAKKYLQFKQIKVDWNKIEDKLNWKQPVRKEELKHLSFDELKILSNLLDEFHSTFMQRQFELACRVRELINAKRENIQYDNVDNMVKVALREKGKKIRVVYITTKHVEDSLKIMIGQQGYIYSNSMFGIDDAIPRTESVIRKIYKKINYAMQSTALNVLGKKLSTHWFRASRIVLLLEEGYDLRSIQRLTGHSSLALLEWYLRQAGLDTKQIAIQERKRNIIKW